MVSRDDSQNENDYSVDKKRIDIDWLVPRGMEISNDKSLEL